MANEAANSDGEDTGDDEKGDAEAILKKNKYKNCKVVMSKSSPIPAK